MTGQSVPKMTSSNPPFLAPSPEPGIGTVADWAVAIESLRTPLTLRYTEKGYTLRAGQRGMDDNDVYLPPLRVGALGSARFREAHRVRYAYMTGAMANGIASTAIVQAMAEVGMLGIFGAAGLPLPRIEKAPDPLIEIDPGRQISRTAGQNSRRSSNSAGNRFSRMPSGAATSSGRLQAKYNATCRPATASLHLVQRPRQG